MNWIGRLSNRNQVGDQEMAINLCSDIVNQYGQLIGEYSRLDDELWFSKPEEDGDDALARTQEGLQSNFPSSYECPAGKEKLSRYINNPVSDGGTTSVKETSSSLNDSSSDQSQTSFPVCVPRRRRSRFSTVKKKAAKHAEVEHYSRLDVTPEHRPSNLVRMRKVSDLLRTGFEELGSWGEAVKKCTHCESMETPQWRDGPMGRRTLCNSCSVQYKGGRLFSKYHTLDSNMEESRYWEREDDPNPKPTPKRKKPKVAVGKCMHCETTKTPQWREGPMGHKTLCNACGVQYRHGRLFPEYRPLRSPTFNPALHSHWPKKVQQMRMAKNGEISVVSEDTMRSQNEVNE